jgi:hypothetical protein
MGRLNASLRLAVMFVSKRFVVVFVSDEQAVSRTVAEVAARDPDFFLQSDLYHCVVTELSQAESPLFKGGDAFKASVDVKDRQWVQLLESVAPSTKFSVKPG